MRTWRGPAAVVAAGFALAACFELSGPGSQLSAISPIIAAWPAVIVDDALRDSVGETAPLRVEAFGGDGEPVEDVEVRFIPLDTGLTVRADGVVLGTNVRSTAARIVALVTRGGDVLQTPELPIFVVPRPDSVAPAQDTTYAAKVIPPASAAPVSSAALTVKVMSRVAGAAPAAVQGWVVRYVIVRSPAGPEGQRTTSFGNGAAADTVAYDTTAGNGEAGPIVTFRHALVAQPNDPEVVEVEATIRRVGNNGAGTTFKFILPFDRQ